MSNCSRSGFEAIIETVCCENLPMKHIQEQYEMSPPCSMYLNIYLSVPSVTFTCFILEHQVYLSNLDRSTEVSVYYDSC